MKSDASHIQACRNAWHKHMTFCEDCRRPLDARYPDPEDFCELGKIAYQEYCQAIEANRHVERLTATETDK